MKFISIMHYAPQRRFRRNTGISAIAVLLAVSGMAYAQTTITNGLTVTEPDGAALSVLGGSATLSAPTTKIVSGSTTATRSVVISAPLPNFYSSVTVDSTGTTVVGGLTTDGLTVTGGTTLNGGPTTINSTLTQVNGASQFVGSLTQSGGDFNAISANGQNSITVNDTAVTITGTQGKGTQAPELSIGTGGDGSNVSLTNNTGHGLTVTGTQTVLSGGTHSSFLTLNDSGAQFSNSAGQPVRVTGVADGTAPYDAVNVRQLQHQETLLSGGIAATAALAAIPPADADKTLAIGMGTGAYNGEVGLALGASYRITDEIQFRGGAGFVPTSGRRAVGSAGIAYSW
jgi:trimeric autotransporter adhesin